MILPDVNVLVYAHREDSSHHSDYLDWLNQVLNSDTAFGIPDQLSPSGEPSAHLWRSHSLDLAMQFAESLRNHPNAGTLAPGERHWDIFHRLCRHQVAF
ncbi:MAG: hypothetical protein NW701_18605 [Nitrospira sp.]